MKVIVGAALASWFLMAPPIDNGWIAGFDASTPVSRWMVVNTYDSAEECDLVRQWRVMNALRDLDQAKDQLKRLRRHRLLIWDYLWECDSSDDPRLRRGD
ncbi:MAG TPA: hypothetical protein VKB84_24395 [Candidatus Binataceae bacterium]|nr:hypothetical protein [Candidatus Binataceae bacterium]